MRAIEVNSEFWGVPTLLLMENAGASVAEVIRRKLEERGLETGRILVFSGSGGKAGDSFVAARHLDTFGYRVKVLLVSREIKHPDAAINFRVLRESTEVEIKEFRIGEEVSEEFDVVVDGLLGTGIRGPPKEPIASAIRVINSIKALKVAIDVPSGLNPDTGEAYGEVVKAGVTVTMHAVKPGLLKRKDLTGEIIVANIGIPKAAIRRAGPGDVVAWYRRKEKKAKKGDGGKVLVVAGSETYVGAPWLTALGAWVGGADLVYLVSPEEVLKSRFSPEVIGIKLSGEAFNVGHVRQLRELISKVDVVAVGPGLGISEETKEAVRELLNTTKLMGKPVVIDADGLKAIPPPSSFDFGGRAVLTPHLGEASVLIGRKVENEVSSRIKVAEELAKKYNTTVLLKGFVDVITDGRRTKLREGFGTEDMSRGSTGDVLTGLVAAIYCRCGDPFRAAVAASFVNAVAGEYSYLSKGAATPLNIVEVIPKVLKDPVKFTRELIDLRKGT